MAEQDPILRSVAAMKPERVLDVGCGCGSFTSKLASHCQSITAIDSSSGLIERCRRENFRPNVTYLTMDACAIQFPDRSFDLVLERATLHHIPDWEKALDEMLRCSSRGLLIEEPVDDHRSEGKRNAIAAQRVMLELQREVGYVHFEHLKTETLTEFFTRRGIPAKIEIFRSDEPLDIPDFLEGLEFFAEKSARSEYWLGRLEALKQELLDKTACDSDTVLISVGI